MKVKIISILILSCGLSVSFAKECITAKKVEYIDAGNIPTAHNGNDINNAVIFGYEGGQIISLRSDINLNDTGGKGIFVLITTAFTADKRVTAWGDENCNYVDKVRLHN